MVGSPFVHGSRPIGREGSRRTRGMTILYAAAWSHTPVEHPSGGLVFDHRVVTFGWPPSRKRGGHHLFWFGGVRLPGSWSQQLSEVVWSESAVAVPRHRRGGGGHGCRAGCCGKHRGVLTPGSSHTVKYGMRPVHLGNKVLRLTVTARPPMLTGPTIPRLCGVPSILAPRLPGGHSSHWVHVPGA